jgi:ribosome-associated protein
MPNHDNSFDPDEEYLGPSKSELKRQMTALQEIGESLIKLSNKQLKKMPLGDERLLQAIEETRRIKSHNARRRHMQFIGRLMRDVDSEPIIAALALMQAQKQEKDAAFHALEALRDEVLEQGPGGVELIMQRWANADRQQMRQLVLQHQREVKQEKPPAASRKLFKYLRELSAQAGQEN